MQPHLILSSEIEVKILKETCKVKRGCADFTCDSIKEHEVLKVGDFSPLPSLRHVGRLEELTRRRQGNTSEQQTNAWKFIEMYVEDGGRLFA